MENGIGLKWNVFNFLKKKKKIVLKLFGNSIFAT
jgi:hypothetical protein